jgi:LacI family transcriptional regulator
MASWREALEAHGLIPDERLILRTPAERQGGAQLLRRIAAMSDPPTAVYIADPLAAVGCIIEAQRTGMRIPGDLSIVGFDDSDVGAIVYPQMTAVRQDAAAIGREAFDALHTMFKSGEPAPPVRKALNTWLEVHDSTGPVKTTAAEA